MCGQSGHVPRTQQVPSDLQARDNSAPLLSQGLTSYLYLRQESKVTASEKHQSHQASVYEAGRKDGVWS